MEMRTKLLYSIYILLFVCFTSVEALAQNTNLPDQDCYFASTDGCITIGYQSVTPHINQPGESQNAKLDVELIFKACSDVKEIKITPTQGQEQSISGSQITGEIQTQPFTVNASSFKDGKLKVSIEFVSGAKTTVDIVFREDLECGALIPLPVELTSFKGLPSQSGIDLNWSTASEQDNSHFEVERSSDGQAYDPIGKVEGHGNSSVALNYSFTDINPLQGTNYYRLKQVDFSGQHQYSNTIAVTSTLEDAMQVMVAPNPCRNSDCEVLVRGNRQALQTLLELKDMSGKVVMTKLMQNQGGFIKLTPEELKSHKGMFILTATSGDKVVHQRVVLE